jgi:hypothetical protein
MIAALDLLGRAVLVGVFVVAGVAKLRDRTATREALADGFSSTVVLDRALDR